MCQAVIQSWIPGRMWQLPQRAHNTLKHTLQHVSVLFLTQTPSYMYQITSDTEQKVSKQSFTTFPLWLLLFKKNLDRYPRFQV